MCYITNTFDFRISGNAASNKNIHGTVSEQLKKNFAKSRWKVRMILCYFYYCDYFIYSKRTMRQQLFVRCNEWPSAVVVAEAVVPYHNVVCPLVNHVAA